MKGVQRSIASKGLLRRSTHGFVAGVIGFGYWWLFSLLSAVKEPWDGLYYWSAAYPGSLLLSAALGFIIRRDALVIGVSITFAQLPLLGLNTQLQTSLMTGAIYLGCLSLPTALATYAGTTLRGVERR